MHLHKRKQILWKYSYSAISLLSFFFLAYLKLSQCNLDKNDLLFQLKVTIVFAFRYAKNNRPLVDKATAQFCHFLLLFLDFGNVEMQDRSKLLF